MCNDKIFAGYYEEFYSTVYKYILLKVCKLELSEDLTSDVFISCYKKFDYLDPTQANF